jgi:exopolyphosphatase/guanosine-5'-triphosphate,3'-diphosphate pyrophosphatase
VYGPLREMPRFASIDIGSNASRLLVVEAESAEKVIELASVRKPVRMGHSVFLTGKLDPKSIDGCVKVLREFARRIEELEVDEVRAVVTASARDAENASVLLEKARDAGVELEAIDGTEEARLVKVAVETKIPLATRRALLCDLGGGSLELSEVHHDEVRFSASLEIGTVRLLESFLDDGKPVTKAQEQVLVEYIERVLAPVAQGFMRKSYDLVAGTGGNFDTIAELASIPGRALPTIDVNAARKLLARMKKMTAAARRKRFGLRPDRADVIVPALYSLIAVADLARTDEVVAPGVGLKEGIVAELVEKHFRVWDPKLDEHLATRAAIQLGRRYHFDEPHATQVDRIATQLFDRLATVHQLGAEDRVLLRVAAITHDIGDFVEPSAHHKHTQYILEHSDIMGLSPELRVVVGCIARYHRRAEPSLKHESYGGLAADEQRKVRKLSAILRIADALDRGHRSKVQKLDIAVSAREVSLKAAGREDLSLEVWTAARKAALFEQTFKRPVRVVTT